MSVEEATVTVETRDRVTKRPGAALHPAISSLMGIYMVTQIAGPIMDKLRPMARFHLPFADTAETVYRAFDVCACSVFPWARWGQSDRGFEGLREIYRQVNWLNIDFSKRLHNDSISEATTNAITSLDCFAQRDRFFDF